MMDVFVKIVNGSKLKTIVVKSSILDFSLGSEDASGFSVIPEEI